MAWTLPSTIDLFIKTSEIASRALDDSINDFVNCKNAFLDDIANLPRQTSSNITADSVNNFTMPPLHIPNNINATSIVKVMGTQINFIETVNIMKESQVFQASVAFLLIISLRAILS